jgi:hypothetical protein
MYCDTDSAYMVLTGEFESLIKQELKAEFEKENTAGFQEKRIAKTNENQDCSR